jgi:CBS domain containing-hemolysin-like protein
VDPTLCWLVAAAAALCVGSLSLVLGALRGYSLARFEQRLEGDPARLARMKAFLEEDEELAFAVTVLRGVLTAGGMVALTGAVVGETVARAGADGVGPGGWAIAGLEAGVLGVALFVAAGTTVPASIGEGRAESILLRLESVIRWGDRLARPLTWLFAGLSTVFLRVFNVQEMDDKEEAKDELLSAALAGENEGVIDEATMDVIENLIEFRDVEATEVMTPRIDMITVDAGSSIDELLAVALEHEKSRIPVVDGSVDKIVGVLIVKDLLRALGDSSVEPASLFRKPIFVPETKRVADLLKELRARKVHMAIVADEYGGTAGLVTIEDLIEEIIGDIEDEHDKEEAVPPLRRISDKLLDVDGKYHIDVLNEEFGTKIPEDEDVETVGGFMALKLGRIPTQGDRVDVNGTSFVVTEADERRVGRVQVRLHA